MVNFLLFYFWEKKRNRVNKEKKKTHTQGESSSRREDMMIAMTTTTATNEPTKQRRNPTLRFIFKYVYWSTYSQPVTILQFYKFTIPTSTRQLWVMMMLIRSFRLVHIIIVVDKMVVMVVRSFIRSFWI